MRKHSPLKFPVMPDVAMHIHEQPQGTLDWVGMSEITMPLAVLDGTELHNMQAMVKLLVDLGDSRAKGIHMSRLYLELNSLGSNLPLVPSKMREFLKALRNSHVDTSEHALAEFSFNALLRRKALVSNNYGWNSYPVVLRGVLNDSSIKVELELRVLYSSTCPASAALARQAIQHQFDLEFEGTEQVPSTMVREWLGSSRGVVATPHGQRSAATLRVLLSDSLDQFPITELVDSVEAAIETPVQTAVKREDEQQFTLLNGQNLMFCEDAARRLKECLNGTSFVEDFIIRVEHFESLHAHNAVSMVTKGVPDGYRTEPW